MPKGKGIMFERKVAQEYRAKGMIVIRSGASLGLFDLIAIDKEKREIWLIQCKKGWSYTKRSLQREAEKIRAFEGSYSIKTLVEYEE